MISTEQFSKFFPNCPEPRTWVVALSTILPKYGINTPKRIASFLAQCGHESGGWRVFKENLNYSAKALDIVFPKYFKNAGIDASDYHRQPEKIANHVYANRMGNGDVSSGDGWKYRGRGPIQLTGKSNYTAFCNDMNITLSDPSQVAENKLIAVLSAVWFWNRNDLNEYADQEDIKGMTRRINGGYNGLDDRIHHYEQIIKALGDQPHIRETEDVPLRPDITGVLKRGSRGEAVIIIQRLLNLTADGDFGPGTERAVKQWQSEHGLYPDGIIGPKTLESLLE